MIVDEVNFVTPAKEARSESFDPQQNEIFEPPARTDGVVANAAESTRKLLTAHPGKLAIGVAATLGMMIYYNWRERRLAKQDPEGHARLQRLKAKVRNRDKAEPAVPPGVSGMSTPG